MKPPPAATDTGPWPAAIVSVAPDELTRVTLRSTEFATHTPSGATVTPTGRLRVAANDSTLPERASITATESAGTDARPPGPRVTTNATAAISTASAVPDAISVRLRFHTGGAGFGSAASNKGGRSASSSRVRGSTA